MMKEIPDLRFHWVKAWKFIPNTRTHLQRSYGEAFVKLKDVIHQEQLDPQKLFVNSFVEGLLPRDSARFH